MFLSHYINIIGIGQKLMCPIQYQSLLVHKAALGPHITKANESLASKHYSFLNPSRFLTKYTDTFLYLYAGGTPFLTYLSKFTDYCN
jgi:hypothetical protein